MRTQKTMKAVGVFSALLALATLFGPIYSTHIVGVESCNMVVKGYNLVEFSPWGSVVLLAPLVLIGLMLGKLKPTVKTVGALGLVLLDGVALSGAVAAAHTWISGVATGFVEPQSHHLIYAFFLLVATVCFWVSTNISLVDTQAELSITVDPSIEVKPVDHRKETFYWCNNVYDAVKYGENGEVARGEGVLCFATGDGYFAGINDGDITNHFGVEFLENDEAVAFVMGETPTGIYGSFYEGQEFLADPIMEVDIVPFNEICEGEGEIKIPQKDGITACGDVYIHPHSPVDIRVSSLEGWEDPTAIGAAVVQGGELVAFVTEYDAEKREYKCVSAEVMAVDLCRRIYERRILEAQHELVDHSFAQN